MDRLYLGKYPPPPYPVPAAAPAGMGVEPFDLYPSGFAGAAQCNDSVFPALDVPDSLHVRRTRLYWATRNQQDAAINAPFLDIARSKWHG